MKKLLSFLLFFLILIGCSDYADQPYTVLVPDAGSDEVVFTDEIGTSIPLDGSNSYDVNGFGFDYLWEIIAAPGDYPASINGANTANPTLEVSPDATGRYELSLIISIGDQKARDIVNVDVNPVFAQVLFVHGIDGMDQATFSVPSDDIQGNPVDPLSPDETYFNIDLNIAQNEEGKVDLVVDYMGEPLSVEAELSALGSYTLYLVGTTDAPELLLVTKTRNQNSIPPTLVGLDAINIAPGTDQVILFIDATSVGFGELPVDVLFGALGIPEPFGILDYKDNTEIFFPSNSLLPLPIWATVGGQRISNDAFITLPALIDKNFGTFVLFADSEAEFGHTFTFINNSELLPE